MLLNEIFTPQSIKLNLEGTTKETALIELVEKMAEAHPECDGAILLTAIQERELKMSTGYSSGIAIPHAFCSGIKNMIGVIGISQRGIDYDALDNKPVHVVFMLAMSEHVQENHLRILNQIFRLAQSDAFMLVRNANNTEDIYNILCQFQ
jgi:PTS system fructose-specific IIC component/PTS system nitrogen regulatory IIA component